RQLLRTIDVAARPELAVRLQRDSLAELQIRKRIREDVQEGAERQQRDYFLRKQMDSIRKELGEDDASVSEGRLHPVPARAVLDADHAGLSDVKDRVTEYLAVRKLRQERGIEADPKSG